MRPLDGWVLLSQSKYRVPSVFDLHQRGLFKERPFVINRCGARLLVDNGLRVGVEYRYLKEEPNTVENTTYGFATKQGIIVLGRDMSLNLVALSDDVPDPEAREEITRVYDDWTRSYLPLKAGKDLDGEELSRKLTASLQEGKRQIREELKKRNGPWVESLNTALTRYFFAWNRGRVAEELFDTYTEAGGEASEADLMEKVAFFNTIYDTRGEENLTKPDGGKWQSEDEMWECWVGYAGSEKEAKRVCRTMDKVFRPMVQ
jgi:hypothetical protein